MHLWVALDWLIQAGLSWVQLQATGGARPLSYASHLLQMSR